MATPTATAPAPARTYPTGGRLAIIVVTAISAAILELIDTSIVNVAIRDISGSLGATTEEVSWVITAYAISNLIVIPLSGFLSNYFGRRNYFTYSIIIFTTASFFCGLAPNLWTLVFFRFIQGLGGGALLSTSQGIIFESFPPEKANTGTAYFGMGIILGPALGPTLGGLIVDNSSWEWIFWINIPIGILATYLSLRYIENQASVTKPKRINWAAIGFLAVGVGSLQYFLEEGNSKDWFSDGGILVTAVLAVVGLAIFIVLELRDKAPVVDLRLVGRSRNLAVGMFLNFVVGLVLFGTIFTWPLLAQISLGWTATMTGLSLMPGAFMTTVSLVATSKLIERGVNPKWFIAGGFLITTGFVWMMHMQSGDSNMRSTFVPLLIRGAGLGMLITPIITLSIQGLRGADLNQGTGLTNMTRQLGGAVGIAVINLYVSHREAQHFSDLAADINLGYESVLRTVEGYTSNFLANGYGQQASEQLGYQIINLKVAKEALLLSYLDSFAFVAVLCLASVPLVLLFRVPKGPIKVAHGE